MVVLQILSDEWVRRIQVGRYRSYNDQDDEGYEKGGDHYEPDNLLVEVGLNTHPEGYIHKNDNCVADYLGKTGSMGKGIYLFVFSAILVHSAFVMIINFFRFKKQ